MRLHAGTYVQGTEGARRGGARQGGCCCRAAAVVSPLLLWGAAVGCCCCAALPLLAAQQLPAAAFHKRPLARPLPPPLPAGSVETSLNLINPLGYAEQVSIGAEVGSQATNVYTLAISQPRPGGLPAVGDLRLHQLSHNYGPWSSYSELLRGGVATLTTCAGAGCEEGQAGEGGRSSGCSRLVQLVGPALEPAPAPGKRRPRPLLPAHPPTHAPLLPPAARTAAWRRRTSWAGGG